jgi:PAS domain S-box-containing protein
LDYQNILLIVTGGTLSQPRNGESKTANDYGCIRILHVDDDPSILEISKQILMDMGNFDIDHACSVDEAFKKMEQQTYDAIISDYEMPQKNGLNFLAQLRGKRNKIPFILFTGKGREEVAIKALNLGANYYLNKVGSPETMYGELAHAIESAVKSIRFELALKAIEEQFRVVFEGASDGILGADPETHQFVLANPKMCELTGYSLDELTKLSIGNIHHKKDLSYVHDMFEKQLKGEIAVAADIPVLNKNGQVIYCDVNSKIVTVENRKVMVGFFRDVSERKKNETALRHSEERFRQLVSSMPSGVAVYEAVDTGEDFVFKDFNPAAEKIEKISRDNVIGNRVTQIFPGVKNFGLFKIFQRVWRTGQPEYFPDAIYKDSKDRGSWRENWVYKLPNGNIVAIYNDITDRKKAEEALRNREERFRAIFDKSFQFVLILDTNGNILEMNELCYTVYGPSAEVSVGKPLWDAAWWSQFPEVQEETKLAIQNCQMGKMVHDEVKFVDRDLQIHQGIRIFSPIKDENGKLLFISLVGLDISDRKRVEDALKKSQEQLKATIENAPIGIATSDTNMTFLSANESFCRALGYSRYELKKLTFKEITHPDDVKGSILLMSELSLGRIPFFSQEKRYIRKDGAIIDGKVTVSAIRDKDGKPEIYIAELEDVTKQKLEREALIQSEAKLRSIVENSSDQIFMLDTNSKFLSINKIAAALSNKSPKEIVGKSIFEVFPETAAQFSNNIKTVFETGKGICLEEKMVAQGQELYISTSLNPVTDNAGNVTAVTGIVRNITERKKAEQEIRSLARFPSENPFAVLRLDKNGVLLYGNPQSRKLLDHLKVRVGEPLPNRWRKTATEALESNHRLQIEEAVEERIFSFSLTPIASEGYINVYGSDITDRKQAQEKLQKNKALLADAEKTGKIGGFEFDINTLTQTWTEETFRIIEIDPSIGAPIVPKGVEFINFPYRSIANQAIQRAIEQGEPYDLELEITTTKGNKRWVHTVGKPNYENGKIKTISGSFQDITEQKKIELALRESQRKYRDLVETSGEFIWEMDSQGRYTYCSPQMEQMWGLKPEDMVGKSPFDVMPPSDRDKALMFFGAMGGSPKPFSGLQTTSVDGQGRLVFVETNGVPYFDEQGTLLGFRGISRDITERKQADAMWRAEKDRLETVTKNLGAGVAIISKDYQTLWANEVLNQIFGNAKGKACFSAYNQRGGICPECGVQEIFETGKSKVVHEQMGKDFEGKTVWSEITATPIRDVNGNVVAGLELVVPITERKIAEEKLREERDRVGLMNEKLRVVGGLTRHDVGNKLALIGSNEFLLRKRLGDRPELVKYLDDIKSAVENSNKLFEVSRLYENIGAEIPSAFNVAQTFNNAVALLPNLGAVKIANRCQGLDVIADSLIVQLFYNLLDNSLKHGEKVTQIQLQFTEKNDEVKLVYDDNGIGVPDADKSKLFTIGFTTGGGSGLGLNLIKKIIEVYGWTITEEGKPSKGAKFVITIPKLNKQQKENYQTK